MNPCELALKFHQHRNASRAEEGDARGVNADPVVSLADGFGERPVEIVGPVAVEPSCDGHVECVAGQCPENVHCYRITSAAFDTIVEGTATPISLAAFRFTISFVFGTPTNGTAPGRSPRMTRTASFAASYPLS